MRRRDPMQTAQTLESASSASAANETQVVSFGLGQELFGVDILKVQEINRMPEITKVPQAPEFVEGVINLRGKVIPVIDLRKRFGLPRREYDKETRIIVVEVADNTVGFVVDNVSAVLRIPEESIEPPPPIAAGVRAEYLSGVAKLDSRLLILLDLDNLLSNEEKAQLGA